MVIRRPTVKIGAQIILSKHRLVVSDQIHTPNVLTVLPDKLFQPLKVNINTYVYTYIF